MEKELQRIANTVLLYSYHIDAQGIQEGKIGIIHFLYQYADYSHNTYYRDFAGDLLDQVLNAVNRTPPDFENGLAGIGWVVNDLIKKDIVEGDPNEVLPDVDKKVFQHMKCDPFISLFGQGLYLLERIKNNRSEPLFEEYITNTLTFCYNGLKEYKGPKSLYHINSVLVFLMEIDKMGGYAKQVRLVRKLLPGIIKEIIEQKRLEEPDLFLFDKILESIPVKQKSKWKEVLLFKPEKVNPAFDLETCIQIAWLEKLYFGKTGIHKPSKREISEFVTKKQESLCVDDFLFSKGLAGLGCLLLS